MNVLHALQTAVHRHLAGQLDQASQLYQKVLAAEPRNADAWHLSGVVALQRGDPRQAEDLIRKALRLNRKNPDYHANLAAALLEQNQADEAEQSCLRCLKWSPGHSQACSLLGNAHRAQGRLSRAVTWYQKSLQAQPESPDTLTNLGVALSELGQLDQGAECLQAALRLQPDLFQAHLNLGAIFRNLEQLEAAHAHLTRAHELQPNSPDALVNLANLARDAGYHDEAATFLEAALELQPDHAGAHNALGILRQSLGDLPAALDSLRRAAELDSRKYATNMLFALSLSEETSWEDALEEHVRWGRQFPPPAFRHAGPRDPERPLRIGYLSGDFRRHATASFLHPLIAAHDPAQFNVHCLAEVIKPDDDTVRFQQRARTFDFTCGRSDAEVAELIREREIDILIDLNGHTAYNRLPVMALGPAPVQVSFMGYPQTTGLPAIHYFISDPFRDPPNEPHRYVEQLVRLPHGACCYEPPSSAPDVAPAPCLSQGHVTFGSLHRLEKLNRRVLEVWAEILDRTPGAELLIARDSLESPRMRAELEARMRAAGIDLSRARMAWDWQNTHLDLYRQIDLLLAVFPWGGGTTSYESLWMGVPAPAPRGDRPAARAAAAAVHYLGRPEWVAETLPEYVELVAAMAANPEQLAADRAALRDAMRATLCHAERFTREFEAALRDLWRRWCAEADAQPAR